MIVCKFGGSSVAKLEGASNIKKIVKTNKNIKFVVVSALGKSDKYTTKITDLLYELYYKLKEKEKNVESEKKGSNEKQKNILDKEINCILDEVFFRYEEMSNLLKIDINWTFFRKKLEKNIKNGQFLPDFIVSRGEHYSAILYSKFLKAKFLDAKDYIIFKKNGSINYAETRKKLKSLNLDKTYVIGGFYGGCQNKIMVFERGGSDITGAIIAKLLNAEIYENYTDVSGIYNKNPNEFEDAVPYKILNYNSAISLIGQNGVIHKTALEELKDSDTLLFVKNTFLPNIIGTIIINDKTDCNPSV